MEVSPSTPDTGRVVAEDHVPCTLSSHSQKRGQPPGRRKVVGDACYAACVARPTFHLPGIDPHLRLGVLRLETKGTLLADSICKWVGGLHFLQVQSIPGLNTNSALRNILHGNLNIYNMEFVILHVATNDVENLDQCLAEYEHNLMQLTSYIKKNNPFVTMAISGIIPRPKDLKKERREELLEHRIDMNKIIGGICERWHYDFLEIWDKFENKDGSPKLDLYAYDLLHPNLKGIGVLQEYYQGAMGAIMGKKYASELSD